MNIYIYTCVPMRAWVSASVYIYMCVCEWEWVRECVCVCVYVREREREAGMTEIKGMHTLSIQVFLGPRHTTASSRLPSKKAMDITRRLWAARAGIQLLMKWGGGEGWASWDTKNQKEKVIESARFCAGGNHTPCIALANRWCLDTQHTRNTWST